MRFLLDQFGLPNISGNSDIGAYSDSENKTTGPFIQRVLRTNTWFQRADVEGQDVVTFSFDASKSNATYINNAALRPSSMSVLVLIRI